MKQLISELKEGAVLQGVSFAVKSAEMCKTKNNKPYLCMTLFDGVSDVRMNIWNYDGWIPEINSVVDVCGKVTCWQSVKQLVGAATNPIMPSDVSIKEFLPKGTLDIEMYYTMATNLIETIQHPVLHEITKNIYTQLKDSICSSPAAKGVHNAYVGGLLEHSVNVARIALCMAKQYDANVDLVIAGALLHDIGKIWTYSMSGVAIGYTLEGSIMEHIAIGSMYLNKFKTKENKYIVVLLEHIILSHHGKLEYGSPVCPKFIEAFIVSNADLLDSTISIYRGCEKDPSKARYLDAKGVIPQSQINDILSLE